eukprot:4495867-Pleurochrysis_carterae.AAC.3
MPPLRKAPSFLDAYRARTEYRRYGRIRTIGCGQFGTAVLLRCPTTQRLTVAKKVVRLRPNFVLNSYRPQLCQCIDKSGGGIGASAARVGGVVPCLEHIAPWRLSPQYYNMRWQLCEHFIVCENLGPIAWKRPRLSLKLRSAYHASYFEEGNAPSAMACHANKAQGRSQSMLYIITDFANGDTLGAAIAAMQARADGPHARAG